MDVYTDLKIGQNLVSLAVTLKDYISTREVKTDLSRCEVVGVRKSRSRADTRTDNLDTISGEGEGAAFTLPVNPIEAPGPRDNILRIKMTRLRTLVRRLKPKNKEEKLG